MNFYLDFEAAQYSEKIISIGCVCDNGNTFYSLVNPKSKNKMSKFIVQLTGITDEMLADAPSANDVFLAFRNYVRENSDGDESYFCYGDCDARFITKTLAIMSDFDAICMAKVLRSELIDISKTIGQFFGVKAVALKKVVAYLRNEPIEQNHISLDDALLLKEAVEGIASVEQPSECPFVECLPIKKQIKNILPKTKVENTKKGFQAINLKTNEVHKFKTVIEALEFVNPSPIKGNKNTTDKMMNTLAQHALNGRTYAGYRWSKIERIDV